jgi:hypothetical protein
MEEKSIFEEKHKAFMTAAYELEEHWDNDAVKHYPEYLPSFDEFAAEFACLLDAEEDKKVGKGGLGGCPYCGNSLYEGDSSGCDGGYGYEVFLECGTCKKQFYVHFAANEWKEM